MLVSHASKVILKILHARLQQYVNQKLSDEQVGLRNAEESNCQQQEKQGKNKEIPEKISTSASLC